MFAPLAANLKVQVVRVEGHIVEAKPDQLGDTQSAGEAQVKHGAVADAEPHGWIGRVEKGFALLGVEVVDHSPIGSLHGDREHAFDLLERLRHAIFDEVHERFDGSQTGIAGARSIAAIALQMFEEGQHERCIDVLDLQGG